MSKRLFLLLVFITVYFSGIAQELSNTRLVIVRSDKKPDELFSELRVAKEDTNKVKVLIFLCGYHWYNERNKDSIGRYAEEARVLSQKLHYQPGFNEACFILLKNYLQNHQINKAINLLPAVPKDQQSRFLIMIGERYLFLPKPEKKDLDSAFYYFSDALRISKSIGHVAMKHESLIALGKYYFSSGQFNKGKDCFLEIIPDFQRTGNRSAEAHIWSELGKYMPDTDSTFRYELWAHGNALKLYHELKDTANEVSVLEDIANVNLYHANFQTSKSQLLQAIQLRKAARMKKLYKLYFAMAWTCHAMGNLDEALSSALEAEKNMKSLQASDMADQISLLLGMIYGDDGQAEKSLPYFLELKGPDKIWNYFICNKVVEQYLRLNQPQKALSFIRDTEKENPVFFTHDKEMLAAARGDCYYALNNPVLAEKYYLQMIQWDEEAQKNRSSDISPTLFNLSGLEAYYKAARFYESQHQYSTAGKYADRALQTHSFTGNHYYNSHLMQKIWWLKFKVDSASGNYVAAIQHYEKYTALKDSIFNAKKSHQLQQLQVQYETEKKETDIKTRDAQIQALTQNDLLRQANLDQAHRIRNITIASLIILLILGTVQYRQYLQKQRSSKLISEKNEQLQHLLTEKEWLLKEVHHRVKNNLHTVICLLESQAAYLESDARQANEVSQQRIYAMSLIHQKIYQSEDVKTIDMAIYLPELIQSLEDSFGNHQIHFSVDIDSVQLDISQAVPVALIINEAVTNSIKYAFPGNRQGTIEISMHRDGDQINLVIADNGVGIDSTLINTASDSLGLQLIKGLSKDIKARVRFDNNHGTRISIVFNLNPFNRNDHTPKAMKKDKVHV